MVMDVKNFFNAVSEEYDELINVAIPRCPEVFWAMLYYLPETFQPKRILELGCGTGNLTRLAANRWPDAEITVVDISQEMLQKTAHKLNSPHLKSIESSFEALELPESHYDLVLASFSIHHLADPEKRRLMGNIFHWLTPKGFFVVADGFLAANDRLSKANQDLYESLALQNGASMTQIEQWREHTRQLDHYTQIPNVLGWMAEAGFESSDLLWRYCHLGVIQGQKP